MALSDRAKYFLITAMADKAVGEEIATAIESGGGGSSFDGSAIAQDLVPAVNQGSNLGNVDTAWGTLYVNAIHFNSLLELSGGGINIVTPNTPGSSDSIALTTGNGGNATGGIFLTTGPGGPFTRGFVSVDANYLQMACPIRMGSNAMTGLADPVDPQDAATKNYVDTKILTFTSAAGSGGASTEQMTLTGLLATDTVLSVTQMTPGSNHLPLIGYSGLLDDNVTGIWASNPGAGSVIVVTIKR